MYLEPSNRSAIKKTYALDSKVFQWTNQVFILGKVLHNLGSVLFDQNVYSTSFSNVLNAYFECLHIYKTSDASNFIPVMVQLVKVLLTTAT